jgi:hypothetical protein
MVNYTSIPSWSKTSEALRELWGFYWSARTAKPVPLTMWQRFIRMFRRRAPIHNPPRALVPENAESLRIKALIEEVTEAITTRDAEIRVADKTIADLIAKKK